MCETYQLEMLQVRATLARLRQENEDDQDELEKIRQALLPHPRSCWVRPWISRRKEYGAFDQLMKELEREDVVSFSNFLRVSPQMYRKIVQLLTPTLASNHPRALSPELKVAITLRYMATGNSYHDLRFMFRVAHNTISLVVHEVVNAIVDVMSEDYIQLPQNQDEWKTVADQFLERWNMPHALGALDGKHVRVKKPVHTGSLHYNYKSYFSIVLMALVDSDYQFRWIDVGSPGGCSDAQIFGDCELQDALEDEELPIPDPDPLPGDDRPMPYFILGDDAFALRTYMMKPYARRQLPHNMLVFNYRLSHARRVVENAFGILANRWACLLTTLNIDVKTAEKVVIAACTLHNMMRQENPTAFNVDTEDANHQVVPGAWRTGKVLKELQIERGNRCTKAASIQREVLMEYFSSEAGSVPWQDTMVIHH